MALGLEGEALIPGQQERRLHAVHEVALGRLRGPEGGARPGQGARGRGRTGQGRAADLRVALRDLAQERGRAGHGVARDHAVEKPSPPQGLRIFRAPPENEAQCRLGSHEPCRALRAAARGQEPQREVRERHPGPGRADAPAGGEGELRARAQGRTGQHRDEGLGDVLDRVAERGEAWLPTRGVVELAHVEPGRERPALRRERHGAHGGIGGQRPSVAGAPAAGLA